MKHLIDFSGKLEIAITPFDENNNLPSLVEEYRDNKQLAINLILNARPYP